MVTGDRPLSSRPQARFQWLISCAGSQVLRCGALRTLPADASLCREASVSLKGQSDPLSAMKTRKMDTLDAQKVRLGKLSEGVLSGGATRPFGAASGSESGHPSACDLARAPKATTSIRELIGIATQFRQQGTMSWSKLRT